MPRHQTIRLTPREASTTRHAVRLYKTFATNHLEVAAVDRILAKLDPPSPTEPAPDVVVEAERAARPPRLKCQGQTFSKDIIWGCQIRPRWMMLQAGHWLPVCNYHQRAWLKYRGAAEHVPLDVWVEERSRASSPAIP